MLLDPITLSIHSPDLGMKHAIVIEAYSADESVPTRLNFTMDLPSNLHCTARIISSAWWLTALRH